MKIIHVDYYKMSAENRMNFGNLSAYTYVICRNSVKVQDNDHIFDFPDGVQIFLHPTETLTLFSEEQFVFHILEFSPEANEVEILRSLPLPSAFSVPPHLAELELWIKSIYDFYYSADKYRAEKTTLQAMMLMYSIAGGDPDGEFLCTETTIDHTGSFCISFRVGFAAARTAPIGLWSDDVYIRLYDRTEAHTILFELQTMRTDRDSYCLGMSLHGCRKGLWNDRVFLFSPVLSALPERVRLECKYDASQRKYTYSAFHDKTRECLFSMLTPDGYIAEELRKDTALLAHVFRNSAAITVTNGLLTYPDSRGTVDLHFLGETDGLSSEDLLKRKLRRLRALVSDEPQKNWSVEEAAAIVNLSKSRFYYLYKEYFNTTFMQDVIRCKIRRACVLLTTTTASVREIAHRLGYENEAFFYRQFKQATGMTTTEYRRNPPGTV